MNKSELVTVVTSKLNNVLSTQEVLMVINMMVTSIEESIGNNQKVTLKSFVSFEPVMKKAKQGTTFGKAWSKPELLSVKVKISSRFKKLLASK